MVIQFSMFDTNYSIQYYSFFSTRLNGSKYCYVIPIILFCIQVNGFKYSILVVLLAHSQMVLSIVIYLEQFN